MKEISVGYNHACALTVDSVAICWDDDFYGQATPAATLTVRCGTACRVSVTGTVTVRGRRVASLRDRASGSCCGSRRRTRKALIVEFARHSPGFEDDLLVIDSTPVECGRSVETTRRSALAQAADYGYCASHSRYCWGFKLHGLFALDGTPRALALTSPKTGEREVALELFARAQRTGPLTVIGDKGYAGRDFERQAAELDVLIVRPRRKDEPGNRPHLAPIRQCVESIFWTAKDMLGLENHGARELHTLRARLASKFLALTAAIALNHRLGRAPRNLTAYYA